MRIGIMLRHYDQHGGGVKVYTHSLLTEIFRMDTQHEYILFYRNPDLVGTFSHFDGVTEVVIRSPSLLIWDQFCVSRYEKVYGIDVLFNPKYSIPLSGKCPRVFVCHGLDWYVMPSGSKLIDRMSHKILIPLYTRKADAVIAVSNTARKHLLDYLGKEENQVFTVYLGVDEVFKKQVTPSQIESTKRSFRLPEHFFLYCGQIYPPKNFGRLLKAYARVGPELGIYLVVAGEHRWLCEKDLALIDTLGLSSWVKMLGWVDHHMLPAIYSLAEALVFPSLYESFGIPILEAMSIGCPVVTSDRFGTAELAGDAAFLVDPEDVESIAKGMRRVVSDERLRSTMISKGHHRAKEFTWQRCAQETISILETVAKRI